jgi:hypothetical protein
MIWVFGCALVGYFAVGLVLAAAVIILGWADKSFDSSELLLAALASFVAWPVMLATWGLNKLDRIRGVK